jgi:hypothetical protein
MIGNERARFCGQCNLNVYNLSSMTKSEAESFIARNEGSVCVRFYRRRDGSIITDNCPIGLRAIRRRMSYLARAVASAVLSFLTGLGVYEAFFGFSRLDNPWRQEVTGEMVATPNVFSEQPALPAEPPMPPVFMGRAMVVSPVKGSFPRKVRRMRH